MVREKDVISRKREIDATLVGSAGGASFNLDDVVLHIADDLYFNCLLCSM